MSAAVRNGPLLACKGRVSKPKRMLLLLLRGIRTASKTSTALTAIATMGRVCHANAIATNLHVAFATDVEQQEQQ